MTQTKMVNKFIARYLPWVGNADLRSLQENIVNAFVYEIGIWNLEYYFLLSPFLPPSTVRPSPYAEKSFPFFRQAPPWIRGKNGL